MSPLNSLTRMNWVVFGCRYVNSSRNLLVRNSQLSEYGNENFIK